MDRDRVQGDGACAFVAVDRRAEGGDRRFGGGACGGGVEGCRAWEAEQAQEA